MFKKNFQNKRFVGPMNQYQNQMYGEQPGFHPGMMQGAPGMGSGMPNDMFQEMPQGMQPEGSMFPQVQGDRLQYEILENRRRINNLTKRIIRLENYLRIRDTSDYVNVDDDQQPNEYKM